MLTIASPLEGVLTLMNLVGLYYSSLGFVAPMWVGYYHALHITVAEFQLVKAAAEAYAYEYYKVLANNFDPGDYSNDSSEKWNVPSFYQFPPGGTTATCKSVDNNIGCTIWNLSGGSDIDPCPNVVGYYLSPFPSTPNVSSVNVKNTLDTLYNDLRNALDVLGVKLSCSSYGIAGSGDTWIFSYNCTIETPTITRSTNKSITFSVSRDWKEVTKNYYCVCHTGTKEETLAKYTVTSYQAMVRISIDGYTILDENAPYVEYFARKNYSTPKYVDYCRIVRT